jgi:predicted dehydrogenase
MIKIGILGAAKVATYAMIAPAQGRADCVVQAVAARDPGRAAVYAAQHNIAHVAPDYAALIARDDVDAVYVALPPALHQQWSEAALAAGKPVLCEKPFAMSAAQTAAMQQSAAQADQVLMEAMHSLCHPLMARARDLAQQLGDIQAAEAVFTIPVADTPGEIRYNPALGGGALMDLGIYPIHWLQHLIGPDLPVIDARARRHAGGVDLETTATFALASGGTAMLRCSMDGERAAYVRLRGAAGTLDIRNPLAPQLGHQLSFNGVHETLSMRASYSYQLDAFLAAARGAAPALISPAQTLGAMQMLGRVHDCGGGAVQL